MECAPPIFEYNKKAKEKNFPGTVSARPPGLISGGQKNAPSFVSNERRQSLLLVFSPAPTRTTFSSSFPSVHIQLEKNVAK